MKQQILAITSGEPAGIGVDICLDLAHQPLPCRVVVLGDKNLFCQRAERLGKTVRIQDFDEGQVPEQGALEVLHIPLDAPCEAGKLDVRNAPYVLQLLDTAHQGIVDKRFSAMVTAPVHKGVINDSQAIDFFSGHTEYLAEKSHTSKVVMMLAGGGLRVALATTHLPLKEVATAITPAGLTEIAEILYRDLQNKFGIKQPRILVAGLNPHAGEGGHLGREELEIIQPVIDSLRNRGMDFRGAYPADTLFQPFLLQDADAVLAMYHDQGLPVLKYASFGQGVNITLGLPFIRTSVDHGTALDLAGTGRAHSGSLLSAVQTAWQMVNAQSPMSQTSQSC